jgi:hypothetical protein
MQHTAEQEITSMAWFAAHVILSVEWKDGVQPHVPVWENIYLVQAADAITALARAKERGIQQVAEEDPSFTWDKRPAKWVYRGVRKVVECGDGQNAPEDGDELSYSEFIVTNEEDVLKLAKGAPVSVQYDE